VAKKIKMKFSTKAIHAGQTADPNNGAVMTPVYLTSTYVQDTQDRPLIQITAQ